MKQSWNTILKFVFLKSFLFYNQIKHFLFVLSQFIYCLLHRGFSPSCKVSTLSSTQYIFYNDLPAYKKWWLCLEEKWVSAYPWTCPWPWSGSPDTCPQCPLAPGLVPASWSFYWTPEKIVLDEFNCNFATQNHQVLYYWVLKSSQTKSLRQDCF